MLSLDLVRSQNRRVVALIRFFLFFVALVFMCFFLSAVRFRLGFFLSVTKIDSVFPFSLAQIQSILIFFFLSLCPSLSLKHLLYYYGLPLLLAPKLSVYFIFFSLFTARFLLNWISYNWGKNRRMSFFSLSCFIQLFDAVSQKNTLLLKNNLNWEYKKGRAVSDIVSIDRLVIILLCDHDDC